MRYDAFISYSHGELPGTAEAIQRGLQHFARRAWQPRALRVFRDQTDKTVTARLWSAIAHAMDNARFLVVLASPTQQGRSGSRSRSTLAMDERFIPTVFLALLAGELYLG